MIKTLFEFFLRDLHSDHLVLKIWMEIAVFAIILSVLSDDHHQMLIEAVDEAAFIETHKVRIFWKCFNFTPMDDTTVRVFMLEQVSRDLLLRSVATYLLFYPVLHKLCIWILSSYFVWKYLVDKSVLWIFPCWWSSDNDSREEHSECLCLFSMGRLLPSCCPWYTASPSSGKDS